MTNATKDGGRAFPVLCNVKDGSDWVARDGMSLRDWFAGQALAGMAGTTTRVMYDEGYSVSETKEALVRQAYGIADAMLEARK